MSDEIDDEVDIDVDVISWMILHLPLIHNWSARFMSCYPSIYKGGRYMWKQFTVEHTAINVGVYRWTSLHLSPSRLHEALLADDSCTLLLSSTLSRTLSRLFLGGAKRLLLRWASSDICNSEISITIPHEMREEEGVWPILEIEFFFFFLVFPN